MKIEWRAITDLQPAPRRLGQVPALDGLRAVAVILVWVSHLGVIRSPVARPFTKSFIPGGYLGVDLFFVLSGFLITALLLEEQRSTGRIGLAAFYQRRAFRLLPALYTFFAMYSVYALITGLSMSETWAGVRGGVLYVTNWSWLWPETPQPPGFSHLWSLAIEGQFYVVWPLALILFAGFKLRRLLPCFVVLALAFVNLHRWMGISEGKNLMELYTGTLTHSDGLLIGLLLAYLWAARRVPVKGLSIAATVAMLVFAGCVIRVPATDPFLYRGGLLLMALCAAVMIVAIVEDAWWLKSFFAVRPLRAIGRVSYGIYIWHLPILFMVSRVGSDWTFFARAAVALAATALVTVASYHFVEQPFLRRKRGGRSPAPTPPATTPRTATS